VERGNFYPKKDKLAFKGRGQDHVTHFLKLSTHSYGRNSRANNSICFK